MDLYPFWTNINLIEIYYFWTNYHQQVEFGLLSEYYHYQKTVSKWWFLAKAQGMVL